MDNDSSKFLPFDFAILFIALLFQHNCNGKPQGNLQLLTPWVSRSTSFKHQPIYYTKNPTKRPCLPVTKITEAKITNFTIKMIYIYQRNFPLFPDRSIENIGTIKDHYRKMLSKRYRSVISQHLFFKAKYLS